MGEDSSEAVLLCIKSLRGVLRPEAAIALRQRLNETVEEVDELRKKHAEMEVQHGRLTRDLTIAKSDCMSFAPTLIASPEHRSLLFK